MRLGYRCKGLLFVFHLYLNQKCTQSGVLVAAACSTDIHLKVPFALVSVSVVAITRKVLDIGQSRRETELRMDVSLQKEIRSKALS